MLLVLLRRRRRRCCWRWPACRRCAWRRSLLFVAWGCWAWATARSSSSCRSASRGDRRDHRHRRRRRRRRRLLPALPPRPAEDVTGSYAPASCCSPSAAVAAPVAPACLSAAGSAPGPQGQRRSQRPGRRRVVSENERLLGLPYCAVGCGLLVDVATASSAASEATRTTPRTTAALREGRAAARNAARRPAGCSTPRSASPSTSRSAASPGTRRSTSSPSASRRSIDRARAGRRRLLRLRPAADRGLLPAGQARQGLHRHQQPGHELPAVHGRAPVAAYRWPRQDGPPPAYADIEPADFFLILGTNMEACHPVLFQRIKAAQARRPRDVKIIVVDPRRTHDRRASPTSTCPCGPAPTSPCSTRAARDCSWPASVDEALHRSAHRGLGRSARVPAAYTAGARRRGSAASTREDIRAAALRLRPGGAALSLWAAWALNQSTAGVDKNNGLINLALATGRSAGRRGAVLADRPAQRDGRPRGRRHVPHLPGHRLVANPEHRAEIERLWGMPAGTIRPRPG